MKINQKNGYFIYSNNTTKVYNSNMINTTSGDHTEHSYMPDGSAEYATLDKIHKIAKNKQKTIEEKNQLIYSYLMMIGVPEEDIPNRLFDDEFETAEESSANAVFNKEKATKAVNDLINFFSEFNFSPSYRFLNTLLLSKDPIKYTRNYFMVQNHNYAIDISNKVTSKEYKQIIHTLRTCGAKPNPINTRFELFFGAPGAGKTTEGYKLTSTQMVCTSDMLPVDLMQNFEFTDGKADFKPSDLWKAMVEGNSILLDEINMLPFESLRFLQGITDGKPSFNFKGYEIKIHPDFKIYATMNLNVNGQILPIPEPLVDRATNIVEFKLTADALVSSLEGFEMSENSSEEPQTTE